MFSWKLKYMIEKEWTINRLDAGDSKVVKVGLLPILPCMGAIPVALCMGKIYPS